MKKTNDNNRGRNNSSFLFFTMKVKVVFLLALSSCSLFTVSGELTLPSHSPTFNIQNLTSSYSAFLDDIYFYLGSVGNVSKECRQQMKTIQLLSNYGDVDALKIYDSSGKPESGILEGGVYFIGFYSECVKLAIPTEGRILQGKYCLLNLNISGVHQEILPDASWQMLKKAVKPATIGLCVPSSCTNEDIKFATDSSLYDNFENVHGEIATCHGNTDGLFHDVPAVLFLCFQCLLILIVITATLYDYYTLWKKQEACRAAAAMSVSTELLCDRPSSANEKSAKLKYLLAFSALSNASKIFTVTSSDNIACLHGLRFLSMALIILGHSFSFYSSNVFIRNPSLASQAPKDFVAQIFANGTFAVDTFFIMSGLLVLLHGLKTLKLAKNKGQWLMIFYIHRYIRLTPLVLAVILNCALLLRYTSSGPNWLESIKMYDVWCRNQWWTNILYIQNFYKTENMCLAHTWYLATDMQMYFVSPFILLPLAWNLKVGLFIMAIFLFVTTVSTAGITAVHHYPAIPYINNIVPLNIMNAYYKDVYIKPYCRMGPYIMGLAVALFFYYKKDIVLKKLSVVFLWILSTSIGLCVIYLMWPANQGYLPSNAEAAAYSALARTAWGFSISWLIFACYYGYAGFINSILSWPAWVPLSRLTFPAYLIHPVIMNAVYGSVEGTREFSYGIMLYYFIGNMFITYFLALILSLLYESPFIVLERLVLTPTPKKMSSTENENIHKKSLEEISNKQVIDP